MKRLLTLLLSISLILNLLPVTAFASNFCINKDIVASGKCGNNMEWTLDSTGRLYLISTGDGGMYDFASANNTPWASYSDEIVGIYTDWYDDYYEDEFPPITIGTHAFENCINLKKVELSAEIKEIHECAFKNCRALESVELYSEDHLRKIGASAFDNCTSLKIFDIQDSSVIEKYAFKNCISLSKVYSSSNKSVKQIAEGAFYNCSALSDIGFAYEILSDYAFYGCNMLYGVDLENTKSIGAYAFANCKNIYSVSIPSSVETIGENAFEKNTILKVYNSTAAETFAIENGYSYEYIGKIPMSACDISIEDTVYTGKSVSPSVKVSYNGQTLTPDTDYTVSFKNCIDAGIATATIYGKGNYINNVTAEFNIMPRSIGECEITVSNAIYTGKAAQPTVDVKDGTRLLTEDVDYTLKYENNVELGIGEVIVNGIGNYEGENTADFKINLNQPKGLKVKATGTSSITLAWTSVKGAEGYYIYKGDKKIATVEGEILSYKVTGLSAATGYSFAVRAYTTVNGKTKTSEKSETLKASTKPKKVSWNSTTPLDRSVSKAITAKWIRTKCSGYQVQIATDSGFTKGLKKTTISSSLGLSKQFTGLTIGKKYYVRVRAFSKYNGKTVYGSWSTVKSITCK